MIRITRRFRGDRGAVAVWLAVLLVPLLIVGALALDVAGMHTDRQRLQTGADAAALAIAQECALGDCAETDATAGELAAANTPSGGPASGTVTNLDISGGSVEVETASARDFWFAPVIGLENTELVARAAASWNTFPSSGTPVLPLTFYVCELSAQGLPLQFDANGNVVALDVPADGLSMTLSTTKTSQTDCTPNSNNLAPGGFGWIEHNNCVPGSTSIGEPMYSDPGASGSACIDKFEEFRTSGEIVLFPVFDDFNAEKGGGNASYVPIGYIGFRLDAWKFQGSHCSPNVAASECKGNDRWVRGTFLRFAASDGAFESTPDAPNFGSSIVQLRLPGEG